MPKDLTPQDLVVLQSMANEAWQAIPPRSRIRGMTRELDLTGQQAVAWYQACLSLLNSKGAIKPDWIDPIVPVVLLEQPDNGVVVDEAQSFSLDSKKKA